MDKKCLIIEFYESGYCTCTQANEVLHGGMLEKLDGNAGAGFKISTAFLDICKTPSPVLFTQNSAGRIFPKSMKMPFWGFRNVTKKFA